MAVQKPAPQQLEFRGVFLEGNPIARPKNTAGDCDNFRVMPGYWLRKRGGRKGRYYLPGGPWTIQQMHPFIGGQTQLIQIKNGSTVRWTWFDPLTYIPDPLGIQDISTANDSSFALSNPAAATNLTDRAVFYNGLGTIDGNGCKSPFTTLYSTTRYFGREPYLNGSAPGVSWSGGAGYNAVTTSVAIYVGIYHEGTEHYSNGVYCGTITTQTGNGTISVTNLSNLVVPYLNNTERDELYYVFYATVDGGTTPYLILNSSFTGPEKVAINGAGSKSLSLVNGTTNGWVLDLTSERPLKNFPPRPMRQVSMVNGRLYGSLLSGGNSTFTTYQVWPTTYTENVYTSFKFRPELRDLAAVVWSAAAGDDKRGTRLGDPLQCWPLENISLTPNLEIPVLIRPSLDGSKVLVLTTTGTFLLEEQADGLHTWETISLVHGIRSPLHFTVTPYGLVWVTQNRQLVLLGPEGLKVLSEPYQQLINTSVNAVDYVLSPQHQIDRIEIWLNSTRSVVHDFRTGQGYRSTWPDTIQCAKTVFDGSGRRHHVIANTGLYTYETQAETDTIPTTDETFTGTAQDRSSTEVNSTYERNWESFGDLDLRKSLYFIDVTGDVANSATLGTSPMVVEWYADYEEKVSGNKAIVTGTATPQWDKEYSRRYKPSQASKVAYKIVVKHNGHSADDTAFENYVNPQNEGDQAKNFYGSVVRMSFELESPINRT